jgi:hypothetical protein
VTLARLLACPSCARHVRVSEPLCVFCGVVLLKSFRDQPALPPPPRMSRGGLYTYRARALAASAAALVSVSCGGALDPSPTQSATDEAGESDADLTATDAYGAAWFEAGEGYEAGRAMPAYGGVYPIEPIDGSTFRVEPVDAALPVVPLDASVPIDIGQPDAGYGVPWPEDAETPGVNPGGGSPSDDAGIELGGASYGGPSP